MSGARRGPIVPVLPVLFLAPSLLIGTHAAAFRDPKPLPAACDRTIFETRDLRICAALDRQGRAGLLLTNLDDDGNRLVPAKVEETPVRPAPRPRPEAPPAAGNEPGTERSREEAGEPPSVKVVVRSDGDERPAGEGEVEVTTRGEGTTIVINVNPPAPDPPAPIFVPVSGVVAVGGLPGPFRYPEHHHFLGYGHSVSSPGLFSGLGLNPSNRYGLSNGTPCGQGFDCMFGPERPHP
ncbi:MAG: hypothetical protein ACRD5D_01385 [Candidatus Polarisedimenticolia bacterium]